MVRNEIDAEDVSVSDNLGIRTSHADVFHVAAGREEFVFVFGKRLPPRSSGEEETLALSERFILHPFAAKRLAMQLENVLRACQAACETPGSELSAVESCRVDKTAAHGPEALRFLDIVGSLGVVYGLERSFKAYERSLFENRFLVTMGKDSIAGKDRADEAWIKVCERISMPEGFKDLYRENLPFARFIHFGYEENDRGAIHKAYLEFSENPEAGARQKPFRGRPFPLFVGFKWDSLRNERRALTKYTCFPGISARDMMEKLVNMYDGSARSECLQIATEILKTAIGTAGEDGVLFLDVNEEDNSRRSFDINVYRANLDFEMFHPLLFRMCRYFSLPEKRFNELYNQVSSKRLGHISGGIDRDGKDFLTFYYGVEGCLPSARLSCSTVL